MCDLEIGIIADLEGLMLDSLLKMDLRVKTQYEGLRVERWDRG